MNCPVRHCVRLSVVLLLVLTSTALGQVEIDLWQAIGGPPNGAFFDLCVAPDGTFYGSTFSSRNPLFRSDDGGASWVPIGGGLPPFEAFSSRLAASPEGAITLATAGFEIPFRVFESHNGGASWSELDPGGAPPSIIEVTSLGYLPSGNLLMATNSLSGTQELWRSTNRGAGWTRVQTLPTFGTLGIAPDGTALVGFFSPNGILRSTDDGQSFAATGEVTAIDGFAFNNGTVFARVGFQSPAKRLIRSTDGGASWSTTETGLPTSDGSVVSAVVGTGPDTLFAAVGHFSEPDSNAVFKSTDNGDSWTKAGPVFPANSSDEALVASLGSANFAYTDTGGLVLSTFRGLRRSTDMGDSWFVSASGLTASDVSKPRFAPDGALLVTAFGVGIFRSTDHGQSWTLTEFGRANSKGMSFGEGGRAFLPNGSGPPQTSTDSGQTWTPVASPPTNTGFSGPPSVLSTLPTPGGAVLAGTDQGLFRSTDHGASWASVTGIPLGAFSTVENLAVTAGGALLASVDSSLSARMHRSTDDGLTWSPVGLNVFVAEIHVAPNGFIYAATLADGVCVSTDDGLTWTPKNAGLPFPVAQTVTSLSNGTLLTVSEDRALYMSTNNADSWQPVIPAFPNTPWDFEGPFPGGFPSLITAGPNDELLAGTFGDGIVRGSSEVTANLTLPQFATGALDIPDGLRADSIGPVLEPVVVLNKTRLILINNGTTTDRGTIRFRNASGELVPVSIGGEARAEVPYEIGPGGTLDLITDGTGDLQTGVIEVVSNRGEASALEGTEAFDLLGNLVSVGNASPRSSLQIYVSKVSDENTGVALFNPDPKNSITVKVTLFDSTGAEVAGKEIELAGRNQLVKFVTEAELFKDYFDANPGDFKGTVTIEGLDDAEFSGFGILQNGETGALIAVSTESEGDPGQLLYTQFVNGVVAEQLNKTRIILINTGAAGDTGTVSFQDATGTAVSVPIGSIPTQSVAYSLDPGTTTELTTDGTGDLVTGVIEVNSDDPDNSGIAGTEVFEILGNFVSVAAAPSRATNQAYVSVTGIESTGVAIYNPDEAMAATLTVILVDAAGRERARKEIELDPRAQLVAFVDQEQLFKDFFDTAPRPFNGTLNIFAADGKKIAVLGLLQDLSSGALIAVRTSPNAFDPGE